VDPLVLGEDLVAQLHQWCPAGCDLLGQLLRRLLQLEPVDEDDVGARQGLRVGRPGSKVCELVPSGTIPVMSARSPITAAAIEVIGATVVTTERRSSPEAAASASSPQPAVASRARPTPRRARRRGRAEVNGG
jgi:hypothetical protein